MSDNDSINEDIVSQTYKKVPVDNPPPALDAAILAASRREVHSRPQSLIAKWKVPVSIAAVLTLSVSVIFTMYDEYGPSIWQHDIEEVSYSIPDSNNSNVIAPEFDSLEDKQSNQNVQEELVVLSDEQHTDAAMASASAATMVAEPRALVTNEGTQIVANDASDIVMQKRNNVAVKQDIETIKEKAQKLEAEISAMQGMQEELKQEKQVIAKSLQSNELKRNEISEKVKVLTKKANAVKHQEVAIASKQRARAQILKDMWLIKIKSLWEDDNKELAKVELKRYLEFKQIDKATLKEKLPAELLALEN